MIGSGKSSVADGIAKRLGYQRYSSGDFMRKLAQERNMSLIELSRIAEKDSEIDKEIDKRQAQLGQNLDNFVIDGRLAWYFIPKSIKIYLDVSEKEAARRIHKAKKETRQTEQFSSLKELAKKIQERKKSEIKRYQEYYGVNHHDKKNYDIYIDTTNIGIEEAINDLIREINKFIQK